MSQIGELSVRISADTTGLDSGLSRTSAGLKKTAAELRTGANQFAKWASAAAAAATAAAAAIYQSSAQQIDQLAKTADKLGIATDQLAGLRFAAEQTGIAQNTLDMALQRSTRRIAEAAQGTGEAVKALDELQLSAVELARLSPDQQMRRIADAMQNVEGEGRRLALAFKLFDSEGAALVNTLRGGSESLDEFQRQAEAMGIAISRVDAAQVEAANDAMNRVRQTLKGVAMQATVELAPVVEALADRFTAAATAGDGIGSSVVDAMQRSSMAVGKFADFLRGIEVSAKVVQLGFIGLGAAIVSVITTVIEGWAQLFAGITDGISDLIKLVNRIPGVEIPTDGIDYLTASNMAAVDSMREMRAEAVASTKEVAAELAELAAQPMPSEKVEEFFNTIREESARLREEAAANIPTPGGEETGPTFADTLREQFEEEFQARMDKFKSEAELEAQEYAAKIMRLREYLENDRITREEYGAIVEQESARHAQVLTKIQEAEEQAKRDAMIAGADQMLAAIGQFGKESTALQKAVSLAQASIAIATGIAKAQALGFPANLAEMARVASVGASVAKTIRGASVGGGSMGTAAASAGSGVLSVAAAAAPQATAQPSEPQKSFQIDLRGRDMYSAESVRGLIDLINQQVGDGVTLRTSVS